MCSVNHKFVNTKTAKRNVCVKLTTNQSINVNVNGVVKGKVNLSTINEIKAAKMPYNC